MSLDVDLMVTKPCSVYSGNITHNLGKMAKEVKYSAEKDDGYGDLTLYEVLWRPDEMGYVYAKDIADLLDIGWNILLADPEKFKKFNPENGWGSYEGLCLFVYNYRNACWDTPDAELSVSR
jgi:hypothetical protein